MGRLKDKVALVTGASRGLGAAIAERFAEEGAIVILTDILVEEGREVAGGLANARFVKLDVSSEGEWKRAIGEVVERSGHLDILVNNAGFAHLDEIENCSLEDFQQHQRVILEGTFLGCKVALPALKKSAGGAIVNVTALAAERGVETLPAYSAAKAGIHGLSRSIAANFKTRGYAVRVNCVAPGAHDTPMTQAQVRQRMPAIDGVTPAVPSMAAPIEVANAVLFLASDESHHINGQILFVDNAQSISTRSSAFLALDAA